MKVIFIKDTLKNPAHKQIKKVTVEHFFVRYQTERPQWFCDFLKEHNIKFEIL